MKGLAPEDKVQSLQTFLVDYRTWLTQLGATANTVRAYHSRVKHFFVFLEYAGLKETEVLKNPQFFVEAAELYRDFLKQSEIAGTSINATLNALDNFARFSGLECNSIQREQCRIRMGKILSLDEQESFLKSVERQVSLRDRALALLLFYTGIRIGDCALLDTADVSIDSKTSLVLDRPTGKDMTPALSGYVNELTTLENLSSNELEESKKKIPVSGFIRLHSGSDVPLNHAVTLVLRTWLKERKHLALGSEEPALWLNHQGKRLSIAGIDFVVRRVGWQANLVLSSEVLRRTCLAHAARNSSKTLQAVQFGQHVNLTTMNRYTALGQSKEGRLIDDLLSR